MTSLMCWTGVDQRRNSSLYLASDSRISTPTGGWNAGRKLFACKFSPDVLGYCGEAFFPTTVLGQIAESIDLGLLYGPEDSLTIRLNRIIETLQNSLVDYFYENVRFDVIYGSRSGSEMESNFHVVLISCREKQIQWRILPTPEKSDLVLVIGSGKDSVNKSVYNWRDSDAAGTSRMFFSAFWDAVESGDDPRTAGPPQLVGIYRKGPAKTFGIIYNGGRFINGHSLGNEIQTDAVKWHNELFEICDGNSKLRKPTAQLQPRPLNLE
ncbi:MAG: hypothetical protein E6H09_23645 [Bacteroidetes bacterium]|nr:MAG: hypothetical protein E6H09_23645 [Bacteroidota bacterium]